MNRSRLLIRIRMLNEKLRSYGFDEGLVGTDTVPSMDNDFTSALINYRKSIERSIEQARNLMAIALQRDYKELAYSLEGDITRLEKLSDEIMATQLDVADLEVSSISIAADAIHSARAKSK